MSQLKEGVIRWDVVEHDRGLGGILSLRGMLKMGDTVYERQMYLHLFNKSKPKCMQYKVNPHVLRTSMLQAKAALELCRLRHHKIQVTVHTVHLPTNLTPNQQRVLDKVQELLSGTFGNALEELSTLDEFEDRWQGD
uniref:Uncharacterized protein n=1 Tax=Pseudomonas phage vB_PaeS_HTN2 TaxID=3236647 RepID=A0AB39AI37_9VIRU